MKCVVNCKNESRSIEGLPTESGIYQSDDPASTFMLVFSSSKLRIVWNADNHELLKGDAERFWIKYTWTKLPIGSEVKFVQE